MDAKKVAKDYPDCLFHAYAAKAREIYYRDFEIDFDDLPEISPSEHGAYVQAWCWVPRESVDPDYNPDTSD